MDRRFLDPLVTAPLNALRAELGLPPIDRLFHRWIHEADLTLGLSPPAFAPPQPDWPAGVQMTGFPLCDHGGEAPLPPEVERFLAAGDPPVAFTAGTANAASHAFFEASVRACERLGRRGHAATAGHARSRIGEAWQREAPSQGTDRPGPASGTIPACQNCCSRASSRRWPAPPALDRRRHGRSTHQARP